MRTRTSSHPNKVPEVSGDGVRVIRRKGGGEKDKRPGADGKRRRRKAPVLSPEETVARLGTLYVTLAKRGFRSISALSRVSKVPYETLRHFVESEKHHLTPVNEERLARALGFNPAFFRWMIDRSAACMDWHRRCLIKLAAHAEWLSFAQTTAQLRPTHGIDTAPS